MRSTNSRNTDNRLLVARSQAAAMLSLSLRTLDLLLKRGDLPARKVGKRVLIPRRALEEFAQAAGHLRAGKS